MIHGQIAQNTLDGYQLKEVELMDFTHEPFRNQYLSFIEIPSDLVPPYVYESHDPRFAFVHVYYHATLFMEFYNSVLTRLGLMNLSDLKIGLEKFSENHRTTGGWAYCENKKVLFVFDSPVINENDIYHEIAHEIHYNFNREAFNSPNKSDASIVNEGTAVLLTCLFTQNPTVSSGKDGELPRTLDSNIDFSKGVKTVKDILEETIQQPRFEENFPTKFKFINRVLNGELPKATPKYLASPDPYYLSHIFCHPLWMASKKFGSKKIIELYLMSLKNPIFPHYKDFLKTLLANAEMNFETELYDFLKIPFEKIISDF